MEPIHHLVRLAAADGRLVFLRHGACRREIPHLLIANSKVPEAGTHGGKPVVAFSAACDLAPSLFGL
jgi:hypothetical protein